MEYALYYYHPIYIELIAKTRTDEIVEIKCFANTKKLNPYLPQINITEITHLLSCHR